MKILVTGGSGFIGTPLVAELLRKKHDVIIYDIMQSLTYPELCIIGDVRDKDLLTSSMKGIDVVYHLAAEHRDDLRPASLYYEVNVDGARNIVSSLQKNCLKKLIFTSTTAVYGINAKEPNETALVSPFNDYGKSKYKAELILDDWAKSSKSNGLVIVRPTVIFGENNRGNVYNLIYQLATGKFIMVGNGKNKKSMGYVLNLTHCLVALLNVNPGKYVYNYADKPDLRINELIRIIQNALGKKPNNVRIPYSVGLLGGYGYDLLAKITGKTYPISSIRIKKFCANTTFRSDKLEETGFVAPYSLKDGLYRMIQNEFLQKEQRVISK